MRLTPEQVRFFHEQGYLVAHGVVPPSDLAPVIDEIERVVDAKAHKLHAQGRIKSLGEGLPFAQRFVHLFAQSGEINTGLDIMLYQGQAIFDFLRNGHLLDAIECLVGPEITCNPIQHLRALPPSRLIANGADYFFRAPWHQDSAVICDDADASAIITCWMPLVDATVANGCMQLMPGVFRRGHLPHVVDGIKTTIDPAALPSVPGLDVPCPKGGVVFMNKFTPHRSGTNATDTARWSLDLRYQPTGQPTGRPFHPEFIARSRASPSSVLTDHTAWCHRWNHAFANPPKQPGHRVLQHGAAVYFRGGVSVG